MHTTRHVRAGLATAVLGLAILTAGCGGSSTKATPLATLPTTTNAPTTSGTTGSNGATAATASQLSAVESDLGAAGKSLAASDNAISGADVNQAKAQEGSAP